MLYYYILYYIFCESGGFAKKSDRSRKGKCGELKGKQLAGKGVDRSRNSIRGKDKLNFICWNVGEGLILGVRLIIRTE